jgi:magnesium transporter
MKSEFLKREEHGLAWVDIHAPTEEELIEAGLQYELPLSLIKECLDGSVLPKYEEHGFTKFLLLRGFQSLETGTHIDDLTSRIAIFLNEDFLVTVHRTGYDHIKRIRDAVMSEVRKDNARMVAMTIKQNANQAAHSLDAQPRRNPYFKQIMFSEKLQSDVIFFTLKHVLESFETPLDVFEERFETCEEKIVSQENEKEIFAESYTLKRQLFGCHRALRMNLDVVRKMEGILPRHNKDLEYLKADSERFLGLIDAEIDNLHNLMTLQMSLQSHHTNEIMRVLAIFSAFFMPLTFIAGVYGMNFRAMPALEHPMGFSGILVLMLFVSAIIYWYFRRKKWIGSSTELVESNPSKSKKEEASPHSISLPKEPAHSALPSTKEKNAA